MHALQAFPSGEASYCVPATGAKLTLVNAKPTLHAYIGCLPGDQYSGELRPMYRTGALLQLCCGGAEQGRTAQDVLAPAWALPVLVESD